MSYSFRLMVLGSLFIGLGCSDSKTNEDFIPPSGNARKALETALTSWQEGQPHGTIATSVNPKIEVLDSKWRSGQKLVSYEILKEDTETNGHRYFTVRLTLGKGSPQEVRYVVIGIDPLWVYREEDFQKLSGTGM
jgi:hypothetical protein